MHVVKAWNSFLIMILLPVSLSMAQTAGTATQPTSTTSANRQQELYDQYHGYNKKNATTTPTTAPVQPQRQDGGYSNKQSTTIDRSSQRGSSEPNESGVRIGVRGGVTYPIFTETQPLLDPKSQLGFVGGITLNFGAGTFSFQPEVNYARYSVEATLPFTTVKATGAFDQIEIPLFLKISSGSYSGSRFFVNVGPYGSYLASVSLNGKKQAIDSSSDRFHFGAAAGVGAALKAGPGHVTFEVRGLYQFGTTETGFSTDSKTILMQGTLGYSFPLGGR